MGSCTYDGMTGAVCFANGVQEFCSAATTPACTYSMNGVDCAIAELSTEPGVYPQVYIFHGATGDLGTLTINADHSQAATCADGSTVMIPASCWDSRPTCGNGTCS